MNQHTMRKADHLRLMKANEVKVDTLKDKVSLQEGNMNAQAEVIESLRMAIGRLEQDIAKRDKWITTKVLEV